MHKLNLLFTFSSLSVLLVTIERFSPTTKILLSPYNFLRLHELVQMSILILLTVFIQTLLVLKATNNLSNFKRRDIYLFFAFIAGVYFYSTGNGVHELASFLFNNYCDIKSFSGNLCGGFFFNDYYLGNIIYFIGAFLMVSATLLFEYSRPNKSYSKKDLPLTVINAVFYSLAIFAYAAFDRVSVGMVYSIITSIFCLGLFFRIRKNYLKYPVITYTMLTYLLGTMSALVIRVF